MKVWIIYDGKFGPCRKLVETLEDLLEGDCDVSVGYAKKISPNDVLTDHPSAILVGGPIHLGRPSRVISTWVRMCYAITQRTGCQVEKSFAFTTWRFTPSCEIIWQQLFRKYPFATDMYPQVLTVQVFAKDHTIDVDSQLKIYEFIDNLKQFLFLRTRILLS